MIDHSNAADLLGVYALDACDADETAHIETHLGECGACASEARRLQELAGWIGVSESVVPPDDLRTALLRTVYGDDGQPIDPAA